MTGSSLASSRRRGAHDPAATTSTAQCADSAPSYSPPTRATLLASLSRILRRTFRSARGGAPAGPRSRRRRRGAVRCATARGRRARSLRGLRAQRRPERRGGGRERGSRAQDPGKGHRGGRDRTPRDRVHVIFSGALRNDALAHYHRRLRASPRPPARRPRCATVQLQCPCAPAERELGLEGGSARGGEHPGRRSAHRSRSACCTDVAQRWKYPRPRRNELTFVAAPGAGREPAEPERHIYRSEAAPACWIIATVTPRDVADRKDGPQERVQPP